MEKDLKTTDKGKILFKYNEIEISGDNFGFYPSIKLEPSANILQIITKLDEKGFSKKYRTMYFPNRESFENYILTFNKFIPMYYSSSDITCKKVLLMKYGIKIKFYD